MDHPTGFGRLGTYALFKPTNKLANTHRLIKEVYQISRLIEGVNRMDP